MDIYLHHVSVVFITVVYKSALDVLGIPLQDSTSLAANTSNNTQRIETTGVHLNSAGHSTNSRLTEQLSEVIQNNAPTINSNNTLTLNNLANNEGPSTSSAQYQFIQPPFVQNRTGGNKYYKYIKQWLLTVVFKVIREILH